MESREARKPGVRTSQGPVQMSDGRRLTFRKYKPPHSHFPFSPLGPPTYHPPSFINGGITLPALSNAVDDNGDNRRETPIVQSTIIQPLRETKSQCEAGFYFTLGHAIPSRFSSHLREASVRYK